MRKVECIHETELLAALQLSRWPHACDETLRAHVESCASCSDLAALSRALLEDHRALVNEANVPSSAIVWWRAQMRSRREAAERAIQPMTVVQGLAAACATGLLIAAAGFVSPTFRGALAWLAGQARSVTAVTAVDVLASPGPLTIGIVAAVCLGLIVAPLALYFTFHEE